MNYNDILCWYEFIVISIALYIQNLAIATANRNDSSLIIANDPDADRLALAEKQLDGSWKVFNGNETGAVLAWWALVNYKQENPQFNGKYMYYMVCQELMKTTKFNSKCVFFP